MIPFPVPLEDEMQAFLQRSNLKGGEMVIETLKIENYTPEI